MLDQHGIQTSDRLLIVNADDFGLSPAANEAIINLFLSNSITSASIMMPGASAEEAARFCTNTTRANIGIHLTLTSTETMDFRPVFQQFLLDSLVTADGYLPKEAVTIERHADPDEVKLELEAQIQSALSMGIDATHLDSHAGSIMGLYTGRDFLDIAFDLCVKYGLPFALPKRAAYHPFFSPEQRELFRKRIVTARDRGILLIDDMIALPYHLEEGETYDRFKAAMVKEIQNAKPGITQLVIHPAVVGDHLKAATRHWEKREMEYRLFRDPELKRLLAHERIRLISWREIRDLQRYRTE